MDLLLHVPYQQVLGTGDNLCQYGTQIITGLNSSTDFITGCDGTTLVVVLMFEVSFLLES